MSSAWKVSRYGVISRPYFPVFGMNTEIYRIQSEHGIILSRNNSVHFSHTTVVILWNGYRANKYTHF